MVPMLVYWRSAPRCNRAVSPPPGVLIQVSGDVNGHLFSELLTATGHCDPQCVALFREGAALLGELPRSGIGKPTHRDTVPSIAELKLSCVRSNATLIQELREDKCAEDLLRLTQADADMGRMSVPLPVEECRIDGILVHPRFGVETWKPDGTRKVRAVDNLSWSAATEFVRRPCKRVLKAASVNGHVAPAEKLQHQTLDSFVQALILFRSIVAAVPGLIKACEFTCCCACGIALDCPL